jgi:glycosyltransferase involved in cell wall biosynthesis
MRLAVYTDISYRRHEGRLFAEESFSLFAAALADWVGRLVLVGRLDPGPGPAHHELPSDVELAPLPHYTSLARPAAVVAAAARSLATFWRVLDEVDCVWLLGPHPYGLAFAALAASRRKRVVLGVRQDIVKYVETRRPGKRGLWLAAILLERSWRLLARVFPVVVVGGELGRHYRHARHQLTSIVSLISERDLADPSRVPARSWEGELRLLSVGRLDPEKNPLLLADVLAILVGREPRWRLVLYGTGSCAEALARRLEALGVADSAELRGYLSLDDGLSDAYRQSHALLHVSWTEGVPQVLLEAFGAGLPVVATAVGGVPELAGEAALLIPAGDARAAASSVERLARDESLRERLSLAGLERARQHTIESESRRLAAFLEGH